MKQIKALQNFAHASGKVFCMGQTYTVQDASAEEFVNAGLASVIEPEQPKQEPKAKKEKYVKPSDSEEQETY